MKLNILLAFFLLVIQNIFAQIIVTEPSIPVESQAVTIIFDATRGTAGLKGYSGDVYAHTGVITDKSSGGSDWKYVKTNWGQNTPATKLTRIGTDLYQLHIGPSIRSYYGVPAQDEILKMAFVFRSSDSSKEGKDTGGTDIFVNVFKEGFIVKFDLPQNNTLAEPGQSVDFRVSSSYDADLTLWINDLLVAETQGKTLDHLSVFNEPGDYMAIAQGVYQADTIADTVYICIREEAALIPMPVHYKKGINYLSDSQVALVLWAPEKEYVYVLGDFNEWRPQNAWQMNRDGDFYWLEIDGLTPGKSYVYQYLIDGALLIADPYTEQVSDPFQDKNISSTVYPGLVEYPSGKTAGLAAVFQTGQVPYAWEVPEFEAPDKTNLVIYELLIRDFHEDHSYTAVIDKLDYLDSLGINVLELMPVNEFEGNSSWGYNPSFYFAPDKYYGPKNELKRLVDECHKRGIAVVIDMVLNHSFGQSPFVQMYFDGGKPALNNPWYNREHNFTNPDAHWGYDFNHESLYTQELVDSINAFWMSEYNIDGFRFDFTKGFGNNIKGSNDSWGSLYDADRIRLLKRMADQIWNRNPDAIVIFEHLSDNAEEKELAEYGILLWGRMDIPYAEAAMGYHTSNKSDVTRVLHTSRGWSKAHLVGYMESHDEERQMYKIKQWGNASGSYSTKNPETASHRVGLNSLFFFPLPGPKMMWMFEELGYDISIDFDCRVCEKPVLWAYYEIAYLRNIYRIMSNMIHLKNTYDVFSKGNLTYSLAGSVKQYRMSLGDHHVFAVGNFDVVPKTTSLLMPQLGVWYEYFSRTTTDVTNSNMIITLEPGDYRLFSTMEMDWKTPMSPVETENVSKMEDFNEIRFFPNPSKDRIYFDQPLLKLEIYTMQGLIVHNQLGKVGSEIMSADIQALTPGSYIVLGMDPDKKLRVGRLVKE
ncbi:MAG TPA: alpha-amylase family glycosyl hydrolase [Saprospiraceae bacterium]|nr:alpha-amylase family glycosyl hydrolase [Saprospiraceae bacterium]